MKHRAGQRVAQNCLSHTLFLVDGDFRDTVVGRNYGVGDAVFEVAVVHLFVH